MAKSIRTKADWDQEIRTYLRCLPQKPGTERQDGDLENQHAWT